jgi:hypothetical protein
MQAMTTASAPAPRSKGGGKNSNGSSSTKKKKTTTGEVSQQKTKRGGGTGLNDAFIVVFGVAFLLSLSLNVIHLTWGTDDGDAPSNGRAGGGSGSSSSTSTASSAIHRAMDEFKKGGKRGRLFVGQKQKQQRQAGLGMNLTNLLVHSSRQGEGTEGGRGGNAGLPGLATLDCTAYGGPSSLEISQEMVYWRDIPSDGLYVSPFSKTPSSSRTASTSAKYLTFEPDGGGWNNIRMAMESTIGLAIAMGRTLVMPPQKKMYLLAKNDNRQRQHFSFVDFFPIEEAAGHNDALTVISMEEYLQREAMAGRLHNKVSCCPRLCVGSAPIPWRWTGKIAPSISVTLGWVVHIVGLKLLSRGGGGVISRRRNNHSTCLHCVCTLSVPPAKCHESHTDTSVVVVFFFFFPTRTS